MPIAGQIALQSFEEPIVLLAGGNTKHLPLEDWASAIVQCCRDVVLLKGTGTDELLPVLQDAMARQGRKNPVRGVFDNFIAAMDYAVSLVHAGDTLLLSPGFHKFGRFHNQFYRDDTLRAC